MIGGLFGIFLGGLVKKNQEIEKIKSISNVLVPISGIIPCPKHVSSIHVVNGCYVCQYSH